MSFTFDFSISYAQFSAERILAYAAFETAAMNPLSVLSFSYDGMSKDKTKV